MGSVPVPNDPPKEQDELLANYSIILPGDYDRKELPIGFSATNSSGVQQFEYRQLVLRTTTNLGIDVIPLKETSKEYDTKEEDEQLVVNRPSALTEEELRGLAELTEKIGLRFPELSTILPDDVDARKEIMRIYCSILQYHGTDYPAYTNLPFHAGQKRSWKDFGPLSYYFTKTKRFVIHVEGELPLKAHEKADLADYVQKYLQKYFPGYKVTVIEKSLGVMFCSRENVLRIGTSSTHWNDQIAGLYVEYDSVVYWASTAHGLEIILASVDSREGASPACVRCLPPEVSLSIDTATTLSCTYKCFKYFDQQRDLKPRLSPSVDMMLGPVSVLTRDLLRDGRNDRIQRMGVAGYRMIGNERFDYYVVEICGYSVTGIFSWERPRVYATLQSGLPMTEGVIMTVPGDGGQMLIREGLPSVQWASGLLAIAPCYASRADANPERAIEPQVGHSGSVWCVLNGSVYSHSCKAFAITVAIAVNFVSKEDDYTGPVWLVSDLHDSLKKLSDNNRRHFGAFEKFKCVGSYFSAPLPDTLS